MDHVKTQTSSPVPRWDDDLLRRRFTIKEERPPISDGARALDMKENLKRHRTYSNSLANRGAWRNKQVES